MFDAAARRALLHRDAAAYARVAIANVRRAYPVQATYLIAEPGPLRAYRELHPAFYGSFDWHSCVEMHWALVRLLRAAPDAVPASEVRRVLDEHLTRAALLAEAAYLEEHPRFERPYGWGWALMLAAELGGWRDADAERWSEHLRPLARRIDAGVREWLPNAIYPVRVGMHANSAFGLVLALPHARAEAREGRPELERAIVEAATRWFSGDESYPADWEPSGSDFLSPALTEAVLMLEILDRPAFVSWLGRFLPLHGADEPRPLLEPAVVSDPTDGQIAHLHGLNLSRAWCMRRIADALPSDDARVTTLRTAAQRHADASLGAVVGSDYMVEHWLAAYAVLLLS